MNLDRPLRYLALVLTLALFALSCSTEDEPYDQPGAVPAVDAGKITVIYVESPTYDHLAAALAESGIFESMAESVTSVVALPADLQAMFTECGEPNAFYSEGRIVMCYEFFDLFTEVFLALSEDPASVQQHVFSTGAFFYLHEIGHALVDQLQIPITGREEDSVDTLATLILLLGGSEDALLSVVQNFAVMAMVAESEGGLPFWDEHSLDAQRQYDIACMIYGSDPERWTGLVAPELLPLERAQRCPAEFLQKSRAWDELLAPHYLERPDPMEL